MRFSHLRSAGSLFSSRRDRAASQRSNRSSTRRLYLLAETLESREVPATVTWDGGAGSMNFFDAANWNTEKVPGEQDDVIIPALANGQAVYIDDLYELRSIKTDAPIVFTTGRKPYPPIPGEYMTTFGRFLVTAGKSELRGGIKLDTRNYTGLSIRATGVGTELYVSASLSAESMTHPLPNPVYFDRFELLTVEAKAGATIRFEANMISKPPRYTFKAEGAGSRVIVSGSETLTIDKELQVIAYDGGDVEFASLKTLTLNPELERIVIDATNTTGQPGPALQTAISMPALERIEDLKTTRDRKTNITVSGIDAWISLPKLVSLTNARVSVSANSEMVPAVLGVGQMKSITNSEFVYSVNQGEFTLDGMTDIRDTSFTSGLGHLTVRVPSGIDLGKTSWDTFWKATNRNAKLTLDTPEIVGYLNQGHFYHFIASGGGQVDSNARRLIDTNDAKIDGGIELRVDTGGKLRMDMQATRGARLDVYADGLMALDQLVDAEFREIRGWDKKFGTLQAMNLARLTVLGYSHYWLSGGSPYITSAKYRIASMNAPKLEEVFGESFVDTAGWSPTAFPAYRTVNWTGNAGTNRWNDSANWSDGRVPGINSTVIIPTGANPSGILLDTSTIVRSIDSRVPLLVESKNERLDVSLMLVSEASKLHGGISLKKATVTTKYSGTTLDIYGSTRFEAYQKTGEYSTWDITRNTLAATNGSWIFVHDTSQLDAVVQELNLRSEGGGSRLIFPSLNRLTLTETARLHSPQSSILITASDRAEIDLPQLRQISADSISLNIDNSWISSPKLTGLNRAKVRIVDPSNDGIRHSDWITADLTEIRNSDLRFEGADIVASFDNVKNIDATDINVLYGKVYFPAVNKIDINAFWAADLKYYEKRSGIYSLYGTNALLEIRANELSGSPPANYRFTIFAGEGLISLDIATIKTPPAENVVINGQATTTGPLLLQARGSGVVRSSATTVEGVQIETYRGGAVALDNVIHGKFRQILENPWEPGGKFYAANMELMTMWNPDWSSNTQIKSIVAPKMRMINGNFEVFANPFPLIESITGNILLKHEPGTPITQLTVFDTPRITTFKNLVIRMEAGTSWPQLRPKSESGGVGAMSLANEPPGSQSQPSTGDAGSGGQPAVMSASLASVEAPKPAAATAKTTPVAVPKAAAKAKPAAKPKAVAKPKPVATKPKAAPAPRKAVAVSKQAAKPNMNR